MLDTTLVQTLARAGHGFYMFSAQVLTYPRSP